jgi:hypothetical protein
LVLTALVLALAATACVKTGEVGVGNATESPVLLRGAPSCRDSADAPSTYGWVQVDPGDEVDHLVMWGTWFGDACVHVSRFDGGGVVSIDVKRGRTYEVGRSGDVLRLEDVGPHDEPWYLDAQRWQWGWQSWWVWVYGGILLLGTPVGLFITVRFFYRYYVLKQG